MSTLIDEWRRMRLNAGSGNGHGYLMDLRSTKNEVRAFLAIQRPGLYSAIVIELPDTIRPRSLTSSSTGAFEVEVAAFQGLRDGRIGVAVNLLDASFEDLFAVFADEILSGVATSPTAQQAAQAVNRCIARWRCFVDSGRRSLSDEEVRGLIGELTVLGRLAGRFGFDRVLSGWKAPGGSIRDFELESSSLEVKSYQVQSGPALRINDPAQLEPSPGRPLHLCAVRLALSDSGRTLPELIRFISDMHSTQPRVVQHFEDLLASYGYLPSQSKRFTDRFSIGPVSVYAVEGGFPRIRPVEVPAGVEDVRFSLPIGAIAPYETSSEAIIGAALETLETMT